MGNIRQTNRVSLKNRRKCFRDKASKIFYKKNIYNCPVPTEKPGF
jgi:hypothetical protein